MKYFFLSFFTAVLFPSRNSYGVCAEYDALYRDTVEDYNAIQYDDNSGNRIMTITENDVIFRYYNKAIKDVGVRIFAENATNNLKLAHWRKDASLKMITHGWLASGFSPSVFGIKDAYLMKMDINIITVDWSDPASWKLYPVPAYLTGQVGGLIANMIDNLVREKVITSDRVHIIGHSLGSHVAGAAGSRLKTGLVSRITGLDPAGPAFEHYNLVGNMLDKSNAAFVDVIHTAGGIAGYYGTIGHADFYPNGGTPPQPGCVETQSISDILKFVGCSHGRAYEYYADSILHPTTYKAFKCESWNDLKNGRCSDLSTAVYMGDTVSFNASGTYYLQTKSEPPYGMNS